MTVPRVGQRRGWTAVAILMNRVLVALDRTPQEDYNDALVVLDETGASTPRRTGDALVEPSVRGGPPSVTRRSRSCVVSPDTPPRRRVADTPTPTGCIGAPDRRRAGRSGGPGGPT